MTTETTTRSARTGWGRTIRLAAAALGLGALCAGGAKLVSAVAAARNAARASSTL